jgi:phosphoglycolate phosphatase
MKKNGVVFFDLDGTLVDTSCDILNSLAYAAESVGFERIDFPRNLIGSRVEEIFRCVIPNADASQIIKLCTAFRAHHDNTPMESWAAYSGLNELLNFMDRENIAYRVVTNRPRTGVNNLYKSGFNYIPLNQYYCVGEFHSEDKTDLLGHLVRHLNLSYRNSILFGDQMKDIEAAQVNNIKGIFCRYGFGSCAEPFESTADSLDDIREIIKLFCR